MQHIELTRQKITKSDVVIFSFKPIFQTLQKQTIMNTVALNNNIRRNFKVTVATEVSPRYNSRMIMDSKSNPVCIMVDGRDNTSRGFERLSHNCRFFVGKKQVSYAKFMNKISK